MLLSYIVRDGTGLIRIGLGVCRPPVGMSFYLGPWGDNEFQSAACRTTRASLSLGDENTRFSTACHLKILSRYESLSQHLARRAVMVCPFEQYPCGVQSLCACCDCRYPSKSKFTTRGELSHRVSIPTHLMIAVERVEMPCYLPCWPTHSKISVRPLTFLAHSG